MNALQTVADSFYAKKLCSRLASGKVRFNLENGLLQFLATLWRFGATYNVHLRLIGKCTVDSY